MAEEDDDFECCCLLSVIKMLCCARFRSEAENRRLQLKKERKRISEQIEKGQCIEVMNLLISELHVIRFDCLFIAHKSAEL